MLVNIIGDLEFWVNKKALQSGMSVDSLVESIIQDYLKTNKIVIEKSEEIPLEIDKKQFCVDFIIKFFSKIYKKKFAIDCEENIDKNLVLSMFVKINNDIQDYEKTVNILQKAIVWYLYQHDNTSPDGNKFPYQLRILLEQKWLLKSCIENTGSLDLNMFLKAQEKGISVKDLSKAMKRGDIGGLEQSENISQMLEDILVRLELFIVNNDLDKKVIKKHPKFAGLYQSELPSSEYIKKAEHALDKLEGQLVKS